MIVKRLLRCLLVGLSLASPLSANAVLLDVYQNIGITSGNTGQLNNTVNYSGVVYHVNNTTGATTFGGAVGGPTFDGEKPSAAVGSVAAGAIAEHEEQAVLLAHGIEAEVTPLEAELGVARTGAIDRPAGDVDEASAVGILDPALQRCGPGLLQRAVDRERERESHVARHEERSVREPLHHLEARTRGDGRRSALRVATTRGE